MLSVTRGVQVKTIGNRNDRPSYQAVLFPGGELVEDAAKASPHNHPRGIRGMIRKACRGRGWERRIREDTHGEGIYKTC